LNNHFELIKRTRVGNSKVWQLNDIGKYVHRQLFLRRKKYENLFGLQYCPVCRKKLDPKLKGGWRENDFDGDIFWDFVSKASKEAGKKYPFVFDVVLPSNGSNDHLFVAEGFLVHNSAGVNLPSHTVLIPSLYRYTASGMARIPVSEYKQQVGRAGRPKYDKEGRGIVVASSESEKQEIMESYVKGSLESVSSMLGFEPVLRTHLLGLVSSGFVFDMASMESFFEKTFYAKQFGSLHSLFGKLDSVLRHLQDMGFVERNENRVSATSLGRRVSELYLDPVSAFEMIKAMGASSKFLPLSYLFLLCNCSELMPWLSVSKSNEAGLWEQMQLRKIEMPVDIDRAMFFDMNLLKKFSTSLMLEQWIEEAREQTIMDDFRTQPGILHSKLAISDWLCYSALELARLLGLEMHFGPLSKMRKRLRHGVREELVFLTEVRHIGRVRARRLWRSNVRSIAELKSIDEKDLARIIGEGPARLVKQALGQGKPKA